MTTPVMAAAEGLMAGASASLLVSIVARLLPASLAQQAGANGRWRRRSGYSRPAGHSAGSAMAPANILRESHAPGPEGLAQLFAFKVGSGLFGVDIAQHGRLAGFAAHLAYGAVCGLLFGLAQATYSWNPIISGSSFGIVVWLIGPVWLLPAMKITPALAREKPLRAATLLFGRVAFGIAAALIFALLNGRLG